MDQKDKELLLQDLCARLPYGVKVQDELGRINKLVIGNADLVRLYYNDFSTYSEEKLSLPYLYPLSSMTEEQTEEIHNLIYQGVSESVDETKEWLKTRKENDLRPITLTYILSYKLVIDWFCKNHFDYRGLIPMGLAIDATGLNIY